MLSSSHKGFQSLRHGVALILSLFFYISLYAEPFECAKITKAIGSVLQNRTSVETGSNSRVELEFTDQTIVRLGSHTSFECVLGASEMVLNSGTLLMSTPKNAKRLGVIKAGGSDRLRQRF